MALSLENGFDRGLETIPFVEITLYDGLLECLETESVPILPFPELWLSSHLTRRPRSVGQATQTQYVLGVQYAPLPTSNTVTTTFMDLGLS